MRRIDIICKFVGPLAISGLVALVKPASASVTVAGVSSVSLALEWWTVVRVWKNNGRLRAAKKARYSASSSLELGRRGEPDLRANPHDVSILQIFLAKGEKALKDARSIIQAHIDGLRYYFSTTVWLPSIGVAVLHASVLAWSGTLITWLLNENFSLTEVTVAKGVGSLFEIGSTFLFPWAVSMLSTSRPQAPATVSYQMIERRSMDDYEGPLHRDSQLAPDKLHGGASEENQFLGNRRLHISVVNVARWAICGLLLFLVPTLIALFSLNRHMADTPPPADAGTAATPSPLTTSTMAAVAFLAFLSVSFLGRWTYDLAVTQLTQMLVPAATRSTFGGTEQALVSAVSLVHWVAAAVWHRQSDFVWLSLGSVGAVAAATGAFTGWVWWWVKDVDRR
ncbi:hypothetical protein MMC22_009951 [Lobaria immixta]|nr:hypothetical protein [Lobaria immixta]